MTETKTSPHASSDLLHPINPAGEPAASGETWVAVADLHGHLGHFEALLAFLDRELGADYRLCTLGDYVDNGREIPALLDRLIALQQTRGERFVPIIGNHDLALLRALGWPGSLANPLWMQRWKERGHLAVEMEAAVLYTLGALHKIETLCIATISDLITSENQAERISDAELKIGVDRMMEVACEVAIG